MTVPYSVVIIKPMSVGRGDAPGILEAILKKCPVTLRMFRALALCRMTQDALTHSNNRPILPPGARGPSWICLFTHIDRVTDPTRILDEYFGDLNPMKVVPGTLRHKFGGMQRFGVTADQNDNAVHLACASRANFEATVLFMDFRDEQV